MFLLQPRFGLIRAFRRLALVVNSFARHGQYPTDLAGGIVSRSGGRIVQKILNLLRGGQFIFKYFNCDKISHEPFDDLPIESQTYYLDIYSERLY